MSVVVRVIEECFGSNVNGKSKDAKYIHKIYACNDFKNKCLEGNQKAGRGATSDGAAGGCGE